MFDYKETMDGILRREVEQGKVVGASALVLRKGEELYCNAFGMADRERGIPMKRDTICRLFSMSKPVTAVSVMTLAERGELDLWDPVSKYLPCFAHQRVWSESQGEIPAKRENTIYDLLNMTSGITYPDLETEPGQRMDRVVRGFIQRRKLGEWVDTQEYMRGIASVPLCFQPGETWMYGFSADVLGGVVETVSGRSFGEFLHKELFEPLEMPDTGFYVPENKLGRFARHYEMTQEGNLIPYTECHLGEYYGEDVAFESGGAGLVSTLDDYSHFATMMTEGGSFKGRRILGRKTVEFMGKNRLTERQKQTYLWDSTKGYGYGCLMRVLEDQGTAGLNASLGEFGWDGWTGNYVSMDPAEGLIFLYFIQRHGDDTAAAVRRMRMVSYAALE